MQPAPPPDEKLVAAFKTVLLGLKKIPLPQLEPSWFEYISSTSTSQSNSHLDLQFRALVNILFLGYEWQSDSGDKQEVFKRVVRSEGKRVPISDGKRVGTKMLQRAGRVAFAQVGKIKKKIAGEFEYEKVGKFTYNRVEDFRLWATYLINHSQAKNLVVSESEYQYGCGTENATEILALIKALAEIAVQDLHVDIKTILLGAYLPSALEKVSRFTSVHRHQNRRFSEFSSDHSFDSQDRVPPSSVAKTHFNQPIDSAKKESLKSSFAKLSKKNHSFALACVIVVELENLLGVITDVFITGKRDPFNSKSKINPILEILNFYLLKKVDQLIDGRDSSNSSASLWKDVLEELKVLFYAKRDEPLSAELARDFDGLFSICQFTRAWRLANNRETNRTLTKIAGNSAQSFLSDYLDAKRVAALAYNHLIDPWYSDVRLIKETNIQFIYENLFVNLTLDPGKIEKTQPSKSEILGNGVRFYTFLSQKPSKLTKPSYSFESVPNQLWVGHKTHFSHLSQQEFVFCAVARYLVNNKRVAK